MAARTGTPSMPSVLPVAAAAAAAAASRSRKQQPGRQNCFPGRRTTQTFKAETLVRDYDCPGGSAAMSPQPATVSSHSTLQLGRHVCVRTRSDGTCHISSLAWWVSPSGTSSETRWIYFHPCRCSSPPRESTVQPKAKAMASDDGRKEPISAHRYHEGELGKGRLNFLS